VQASFLDQPSDLRPADAVVNEDVAVIDGPNPSPTTGSSKQNPDEDDQIERRENEH
jgi:hypothetical protein